MGITIQNAPEDKGKEELRKRFLIALPVYVLGVALSVIVIIHNGMANYMNYMFVPYDVIGWYLIFWMTRSL
jgi:hypothetical protein